MKNKIIRKSDFTRLRRKLFWRIILVTVASAIAVLTLTELMRGHAGDAIIAFIQRIFPFTNEDAHTIYRLVFRNNINLLAVVAVTLCSIMLYHLLLSWIMKYFVEVDSGIDVLMEGEMKEIEMSPEMGFMELKMNKLGSALQERERKAREAEQRKNDLVMYLAHDIKTPLTSIIGYLSLLDEASDMPVKQKAKYVNITLDKAYRLEQLIDEFFEITRYNLQTIRLSKENIDLYYMLVQMADEFYPLLSDNGKRTVIHASEDLAAYGDSDKLARVFNNILKNAAAYSEDNSVIEITAGLTGDMVNIVFKNAGTIPKEKLASIFEKFYRLDNARSSDKGGAGLGLAIAKEIITLHGGQIYAESNHNYTMFTVQLPALPGSIA